MDILQAKEMIKKLTEEINFHNKNYYENDEPVITDYEYDMLLRELETLEIIFPELIKEDSPTKKIGGSANDKFKPVTHRKIMDSLHDSFSIDEIKQFDKKVSDIIKSPVYVVEPKVDGLSVLLEYKNSVLVRASTRGDGEVGEDITENVRAIKTVPLKLSSEVSFLEVRGEVYMSEENFLKLQSYQEINGEKIFKNPRNAAAGSLRQKDSNVTKIRNLDFIAFNIQYAEGITFLTHTQSLNYLEDNNFITTKAFETFSNINDAINKILKIGNEREKFKFPIDGAVIKLDLFSDREKLGRTSKFPKWAEAYKYPPEEKETELLNIEINVGRTGVLTPTGIFKPLKLAGTTVSRAVLHNENFIKEKNIRIGDKVILRKAGEIIPEVVAVKAHSESSKPFSMPEFCPSCGSKVIKEEDEAAYRCVNSECPAQLLRNLIHFASRDAMDIENLGIALLDQLVTQKLVTSFVDLYYLQIETLINLERMGKKSAQNLIKAIEKSKSNDFYRLIYGLGIKNIGLKASRILADRFQNIDRLMVASIDEISNIDGFGEVMAQNIVSYFVLTGTKSMIEKLKSLNINTVNKNLLKSENNIFEGKTFVLTGTLEKYKRKEAAEIIEKFGGKTVGSVSSKTSYVLTGKEAGDKLKKAEKLGIKIISEDDFKKMINF